MKRLDIGILILVASVSITLGGIAGFALGYVSAKYGKVAVDVLTTEEEPAIITDPQRVSRERFEVLYPANWYIDMEDEDYDPDHLFSFDSPGATYVMFFMDEVEADPAANLKNQITAFTALFGSPIIEKFDRYGRYSGSGARLQGDVYGSETIVDIFCCFEAGVTVTVVEQYPEEDLEDVTPGLALIEESFTIRE